jgi:hypothetical protein
MIAEIIASKVISAFKSCPSNGKPKGIEASPTEFTVLAAIVGRIDDKKQVIRHIL